MSISRPSTAASPPLGSPSARRRPAPRHEASHPSPAEAGSGGSDTAVALDSRVRGNDEPGCGLAQRHLEAALGAGAGHHRLVPALDVRVVGEVDLMALVPPSPAEDREIGDRYVIAAGELHVAEALIEDAVEPARLLHVALEPVAAVGFVLHLQEMVDLAGHRPKRPSATSAIRAPAPGAACRPSARTCRFSRRDR